MVGGTAVRRRSGRYGRWVRRRLVPVGLVPLLLAVAGCSTDGAADAVQGVVDRVAPGRYAVVGTQGLGASGLVQVVLADRLDADAAVVAAVDRSGDCGPGTRCERTVLDAVARSGPQAEEHRAVTRAFAGCGHPVVALAGLPGGPGDGQVEVWIAARIADEPITGLVAELDACVAAWRAARAASPSPWARTPVGLTLRVVDPARVAGAPVADPALPPAVRAPDERLAALSGGAEHVVVLGPDDAWSVGAGLRPLWPRERTAAFEAAVTGAAQAWLARTGPATEAVDGVLTVATRVDPAAPARLRAYVLLARRADGSQPAVALTVDRSGGAAAEQAVVPDVRRPDGTFRLPVEPAR